LPQKKNIAEKISMKYTDGEKKERKRGAEKNNRAL